MPRIVIPLQLEETEILPSVCVVTGEREGVQLHPLELEVVTLEWWSLPLLVVGSVMTGKTRVRVGLPLGAQGREQIESAGELRVAVQIIVALLIFGPLLIGLWLVTKGSHTYQTFLTLLGSGVALGLIGMALLELVVVPRLRPVLLRAEGGWLQLSIPSGEAAGGISGCGWPETFEEALRNPRDRPPGVQQRPVGGALLVPHPEDTVAPAPTTSRPVRPQRVLNPGEAACPACGGILDVEELIEPLEFCYHCGEALAS